MVKKKNKIIFQYSIDGVVSTLFHVHSTLQATTHKQNLKYLVVNCEVDVIRLDKGPVCTRTKLQFCALI